MTAPICEPGKPDQSPMRLEHRHSNDDIMFVINTGGGTECGKCGKPIDVVLVEKERVTNYQLLPE